MLVVNAVLGVALTVQVLMSFVINAPQISLLYGHQRNKCNIYPTKQSAKLIKNSNVVIKEKVKYDKSGFPILN